MVHELCLCAVGEEAMGKHIMRFLLPAALTVLLAGCQTELSANATCSQKWEAYANDRMHGAMLGGLAGASMSGRKPDC
jgi:hypothetical protein